MPLSSPVLVAVALVTRVEGLQSSLHWKAPLHSNPVHRQRRLSQMRQESTTSSAPKKPVWIEELVIKLFAC